MRKLILTISLLTGLMHITKGQIQYENDIPTSIQLKNHSTSSNAFYTTHLSPVGGRAIGGFSIGLNGNFTQRWYLINQYMLNGQIVEDFKINYGGTEHMTIKKDGEIGIGTSDIPVGYKLAVNGSAIMEEVKVQISTAWPDYVFGENYNLKQLDEVAAFIKENGHLPNVPSAAEVNEAGGLELGEMNARLLEKIEELTLYAISMQNDLENERSNNADQSALIKTLLERVEKLESQQ